MSSRWGIIHNMLLQEIINDGDALRMTPNVTRVNIKEYLLQ